MDLSAARELAPARLPQPQAVVSLQPLGLHRQLEYALLLPGETLAGYFERIGLQLAGRPVVVRLNGARVPRGLWRHTRPKSGQLIEVQAVVEGGSGRKIVRSVLQIIVSIAALSFGPLSPLGLITYFGGNALINKFLPLPKPNLSDARAGLGSPTYSLAGAQNRLRPYEPLPLVLGTHRIVPDYAAKPYNEFSGEDQYLFAIFNFGVDGPALDVSDLKIGDTPIESYDGVTLEWSDAAGKLTLVAGNVDTVTGGTLTNAVGWITRTSSADATALAIDIEGSLFRQGNEGLEALSATIEAEFRLLPSGAFQGFFEGSITHSTHYWSRGYYTDIPNSEANWLQIDFDNSLDPGKYVEGGFAGYPPGYTADTAPVTLIWHWRPFSAVQPGELAPSSAIVVSATQRVLTSASTKPLRLTYRRAVPQGQYEVRVRRTSPDETDERNTSILQWSALRTYQPDSASYVGQKRLAMKIKASGQLQGVLDSVNAIARRKITYWDGAAWQVGPNSNPAWVFYFLARGLTLNGRLVVGLGLTDAQIDVDALKAWAAFCDTKALTFNAVLDQEIGNGDALDAICAAGWASKTWATGKLGVVWDAGSQPIVGVVNMANIVAGSFRVSYVTGGLPDEVICTYLNAANGYVQEEVRVPANVASPRRPQRIELFGVTSRQQAGRDANLRWADVLYRRKVLQWEMDAEGTIARRGDVLALSHDMTQWGYAGRLVGVATGASTVFTLDRRVPVNGSAPADTWIGVRVPGETGYRVLRVSITGSGPDNDSDQVTLVDAWPGGVDLPGVSRPALDYIYVYDFKATPGFKVKVVETAPRVADDGKVTVQLTAVPEVDAYYAAESGTFAVVAPQTLLVGTPVISRLVISEQLVRIEGALMVELTATWDANAAFSTAIVEGALNNGEVRALGATDAGRRRLSWIAPLTGQWSVTVRPFNALGQPGATLTQNYTVIGKTAPPSNVSALAYSIELFGVRLHWPAVPDLDLAEYELRQGGTTWENAQPLVAGNPTRVGGTDYLWKIRAAGTYRVWVKAIDDGGRFSTAAAFTDVIIAASGAPTATTSFSGASYALQIVAASPGSFATDRFRIRRGADFGSAPVIAEPYSTRFEARVDWVGTQTFWITQLDVAGNESAPYQVQLVVAAPAVPGGFAADLIINVLQFRWNKPAATLPLAKYILRKGATFAAAAVIGDKAGDQTFTTHQEPVGGTFTYWLSAVDAAGNEGPAASLTQKVDDPSNFRLQKDWHDDFSGTKVSCLLDAGVLKAPINVTETWSQHFSSRSWNTPADQIAAGYPRYFMPSTATASYERVFDYGTTINATLISLLLTSAIVSGAVTVTPTISVSNTSATGPWTDFAGVSSVFASGFRWVKIRLDFTAAGGDDLIEVSDINVRLSLKTESDAGRKAAGDFVSGVCAVTFQKAFIDIDSIVATPLTTSRREVAIEFSDVPNPTGFNVRMWDPVTGNLTPTDFSWTAQGVT